ncbi:MAG TPA: CRISPR-associated protein Csx3 [Candidatus Paceibacterota bacterium]
MALTYIVTKTADDMLTVRFGAESQNGPKVVDCKAQLDALAASGELLGGGLMKVNGPASLPVAMTIAHALGHLYEAVACYDPKPNHFVVAIAHGGKYAVGDILPGI